LSDPPLLGCVSMMGGSHWRSAGRVVVIPSQLNTIAAFSMSTTRSWVSFTDTEVASPKGKIISRSSRTGCRAVTVNSVTAWQSEKVVFSSHSPLPARVRTSRSSAQIGGLSGSSSQVATPEAASQVVRTHTDPIWESPGTHTRLSSNGEASSGLDQCTPSTLSSIAPGGGPSVGSVAARVADVGDAGDAGDDAAANDAADAVAGNAVGDDAAAETPSTEVPSINTVDRAKRTAAFRPRAPLPHLVCNLVSLTLSALANSVARNPFSNADPLAWAALLLVPAPNPPLGTAETPVPAAPKALGLQLVPQAAAVRP